MKVKALKTFLFLATNQCDFSVHKILGVPRATMWAHINEIENETGLKLINRRKQNNTLTPEGMAFVPYASKICKIYETGLHEIKSSNADTFIAKGSIVISTTRAVASGWLMPSIKDFHEKYPQLHVNILASDHLTKRVELAADVLLRPMGNQADGIVRKWYIAYHHGLFASREYLERAGEPKTPPDLAKHTVIGYGEQEFSHFENINWHLRGKGYEIPRIEPSLTINSTIAMYTAAREGIGITSAAIESNSVYQGDLIRVLPEIVGPTVKSYFCVKANMSEATQNNVVIFENFIKDYLEGDKGIKLNEEHD